MTIPQGVEALAPCPFCGSAAYCDPDDRGSGGQHVPPYHAGCLSCRVYFTEEEEADAISAWNRRAVPASPVQPDPAERWQAGYQQATWDAQRAPVQPEPVANPSGTFAQCERLLKECLKAEEISGPERNTRLTELIHWFVRYADGNANGKWLRGHAFELAYAIASNPLYAHPSPPVQPQSVQQSGLSHASSTTCAGKAPLSEEQVKTATGYTHQHPSWTMVYSIVRAVERAHGITAEHGTALTQADATAETPGLVAEAWAKGVSFAMEGGFRDRPLLSEEQVSHVMGLVDDCLTDANGIPAVEAYLRNLKEGE